MFIERLVTLGEVFMSCGMKPDEVLRIISDGPQDPRFLENVAVIEVSQQKEGQAAPLPLQTWGYYEEMTPPGKKGRKKKTTFHGDVHRGLGFPFIRPGTGNPTVAQGRYGVPVYPLYPSMAPRLSTTRDAAAGFWRGRLERTLFLPRELNACEIELLSDMLQGFAAALARRATSGNNQGYGLIALCFPAPGGPYSYSQARPQPGDRERTLVGESVLNPGSYIVADLAKVAELFKLSKTEEGAEMGRAARCSLCGNEVGAASRAVSVYTKAWAWLAPTWHPPFPESFKHGDKVINLADTVGALCPDCYTALVVGAGIFEEVSGSLPQWLTRELFLPVLSAGGREEAKKTGRLPDIRGSVLVVPSFEPKEEEAEVLADALALYRQKRPPRPGRTDRGLQAITGLESSILPEELDTDAYRLLMVYFTQSNADLHLRATIEDVLPSTASKLLGIMADVQAAAAELRRLVSTQAPAWLTDRYNSLMYMLIRAYGGAYLWPTLANVLHRRPIGWARFVASAAARMAGYAKLGILAQDGLAYQNLKEEVLFYQVFRRFYELYRHKVLDEGGGNLTSWKEMLRKIAETPGEELSLEEVEELGFAAGYLVARFGRQYYARLEKNFVQHRIMTFGSALTPDDIWRRGLSRFQEYALKLDLHLPEDFRRRAAAVECEYRRLRQAVARQKDEFMGAFWSGYMLATPAEAGKQAGEPANQVASD